MANTDPGGPDPPLPAGERCAHDAASAYTSVQIEITTSTTSKGHRKVQQLTHDLLATGSPLLTEIERRARKSSAGLVETAAALAPLAELSWQEHRTTDFLARRLSQLGWRVQTFGEQSGLIARIGPATSPLKPIGLRMELDALPSGDGGARHTCGHNYHMATIDAAGGILADLASRFGVQVVIIGQPAEEVGTPQCGADFIIQKGGLRYDDGELVSGVLAFHGRTGLRRGTVAVLPNGGPFYAGTAMVIANVTARGGHGGIPWTTTRTAEVFMEFLLALRNAVYCGSLAPYDPVVYVTNVVEIPEISGPTSGPINVIPSGPFNVIPHKGKALGTSGGSRRRRPNKSGEPSTRSSASTTRGTKASTCPWTSKSDMGRRSSTRGSRGTWRKPPAPSRRWSRRSGRHWPRTWASTGLWAECGSASPSSDWGSRTTQKPARFATRSSTTATASPSLRKPKQNCGE